MSENDKVSSKMPVDPVKFNCGQRVFKDIFGNDVNLGCSKIAEGFNFFVLRLPDSWKAGDVLSIKYLKGSFRLSSQNALDFSKVQAGLLDASQVLLADVEREYWLNFLAKVADLVRRKQ